MSKLRLVMSGGSAKGVVEAAGALNAVFERGNVVEIGSGTSAGGIILGALAAGKSPKDIKSMAIETDFSKFVSTGFFSLMRAAFKGCLSDGKDLLKFFTELTGGRLLKDAGFDVRIVGSDYTNGKAQVFRKETHPEMPIALAMRITSAMPLAFSAVEYNGTWYKDGGVYAHVPIEASREPLRMVIFAQADPPDAKPKGWKADAGIVKEVERTLDLLVDANVDEEMQKAPPDAIRVYSDALGFSTFKFDFTRSEKERLYQHGYDLMYRALEVAGL
jgi:NTE family protein